MKKPTIRGLLTKVDALEARVAKLEHGYRMDHIVFGAPFHPSETHTFPSKEDEAPTVSDANTRLWATTDRRP